MNIELNSTEIYAILVAKGITHLHHANTTTTSKSFITQKALLSRFKVEELGFEQTPQSSDEKDKKFGIYNDLFLDGLDLAVYFDKLNVYGPVLFKFSIDMLLLPEISTIRITKLNPHYWNDNHNLNEKYFISTDEFDEHYKTGNKYKDGNCCFVLANLDGVLPFNFGLKEIIVDNPDKVYVKSGQDVWERAKNYLFDKDSSFSIEFPDVALRRRNSFKSKYELLSLKELQKKFKIPSKK